MAVKVEETFINAILEYVGAISSFQQKVLEFEQRQNKMVQIEESKEMQQVDQIWEHNELPPPSLPTYISEIIIAPIKIQLTFVS